MGLSSQAKLHQESLWWFSGLPLHVDSLWNRGAYLIEKFSIWTTWRRTRPMSFSLCFGLLLLRGGIGVPVNPIAIR